MQCVYSAFIFRYWLVPTGSENPKVCVRDVCREFAYELESNVCRSNFNLSCLPLIVLPALYHHLPSIDCSGKKGRAQEQRWFIQKQPSVCAHRPREGTEKQEKKNPFTHSHSDCSSHRWFDYFTEDWCQPLLSLFLLSSEGEVNVFSIGEEAVARFTQWNYLLPVSARIFIQVTVWAPLPISFSFCFCATRIFIQRE